MRKASTKERYTTINLQKAGGPCKIFNNIQKAFALQLEQNPQVKVFQVNVPLTPLDVKQPKGWTPEEPFMSDFLIEYEDGSKVVREAVYRADLNRISVLQKLDYSHWYWQTKKISDWGLVVEKKEHKNVD